MIHTTRWQPDTCGCTIDYTWDDLDPRETREHTPVLVIACDVHVGMPVLAAWEAVRAENRRKNQAVAAAAEAHGCGPEEIEWSMTAERDVLVSRLRD